MKHIYTRGKNGFNDIMTLLNQLIGSRQFLLYRKHFKIFEENCSKKAGTTEGGAVHKFRLQAACSAVYQQGQNYFRSVTNTLKK